MVKKKMKILISFIIIWVIILFLNKLFVEGRYFNVVLWSLLLLVDIFEYMVWCKVVMFNNVIVEEVVSLVIIFVIGFVKWWYKYS